MSELTLVTVLTGAAIALTAWIVTSSAALVVAPIAFVAGAVTAKVLSNG